MMMSFMNYYWSKLRCEKGTTAIEFGIIAPVLFLLILVGMDLSMLLWEQYSLNYAVSNAARYAYVNPSKTSGQIQSYALSVIPTLPDTPSFTINIVPFSKVTINASLTHKALYFPFGSTTITANVVQPLSTP